MIIPAMAIAGSSPRNAPSRFIRHVPDHRRLSSALTVGVVLIIGGLTSSLRSALGPIVSTSRCAQTCVLIQSGATSMEVRSRKRTPDLDPADPRSPAGDRRLV